MKRAALFVGLAAMLATPVLAQRKPVTEQDVALQRGSVQAWTACIAAEKAGDVNRILSQDFTSSGYKIGIKALAQTRVSKECFEAMPREYRSIRLGGLPFAGGLAEHMLEADSVPLLKRLSMAALGPAAATHSRTDAIAMCMVRGAPHMVAGLFGTEIETDAERAALAELKPVADICAGGAGKFEASALGMRSMLATASYRLLAAQKVENDA
ncbi:MAG: hypothetical protein KJZ64_09920 [Sphingomonadaceae bacterium]|nr:hypothetical protein [Sphingomonadaceae bacterium]